MPRMSPIAFIKLLFSGQQVDCAGFSNFFQNRDLGSSYINRKA